MPNAPIVNPITQKSANPQAQASVSEGVRAAPDGLGRHARTIPRILDGMVVAAAPRYEVVCRLAGGGMADLHLARAVAQGVAGTADRVGILVCPPFH